MKCVICKIGETRLGTATVTLERGSVTLVVKGVRAQVCQNCGEEYVDEEVTLRLLEAAEEASRAGGHPELSEDSVAQPAAASGTG